MSDDFQIGKSVLLSPYFDSVAEDYREICGEGGDPHAAFSGFVNSLAGGSSSILQGLAALVHSGGSKSFNTEYRRFLDNGRNCPEGSEGFSRWKSLKIAMAHDPMDLGRKGDEFAEKYAAGVRSITDGYSFAAAWKRLMAATMESIAAAIPAVEELARRFEAGQKVAEEEVRAALSPLVKTYYASTAFVRDSNDKLYSTWDFRFVNTQSAMLSNYMNGIIFYLDYLGTEERMKKALASISSNLPRLLEPFYQTHYSYAIDRHVQNHVVIKAPYHSLKIFPADAIAIALAKDEIIYQAGKIEGARMEIAWNAESRTMSFIDESEGASSLQAFAGNSHNGRASLSGLDSAYGSRIEPKIAVDGKSGRVLRIDIHVPASGTTPPIGNGKAIGKGPSAGEEFGDTVDATGSAGAREALEAAVKGNPEMKEAWGRMTETQRMQAASDLLTYGMALKKKDLKALGTRVYRSVLKLAPPMFSAPGAVAK